MAGKASISEIRYETLESADLRDEQRGLMYALFDECYRDASHAYLDKTLERLRYVTLAFDGDRLVGFGSGENRVIDLPRRPKTRVTLAGLTNVAPRYRRQGLVAEIGGRNLVWESVADPGPILLCGRNAHPAAFSMFTRNDTVVPRPNHVPTAWQQEVGSLVAELFGAENFNPETFVCVGSGTPIGYPVLDIEAEPQEWDVFEPVDRDRGDTLLAIVWLPDAPEGW